jgi:hypothetical protein
MSAFKPYSGPFSFTSFLIALVEGSDSRRFYLQNLTLIRYTAFILNNHKGTEFGGTDLKAINAFAIFNDFSPDDLLFTVDVLNTSNLLKGSSLSLSSS